MESHFENDEPYWPQVNNATYKEVWVAPATKWMWCMADNLLPARLSGYVKLEPNAELLFKHYVTRKVYAVTPHPHTGWFELELPAGRYEMVYGNSSRRITLISGREYQFNGAIYSMEVSSYKEGGVVTLTVRVKGESDLPIEIQADNVEGLDKKTTVILQKGEGEITFTGRIINPRKPYVGVVIPNGCRGDQAEFIDEFLKH